MSAAKRNCWTVIRWCTGERKTPGGIALLEVKGRQLWGYDKEPDKAEAVHPDYGRVFVAGHRRNESEFWILRKSSDRLERVNPFSIEQLRWKS